MPGTSSGRLRAALAAALLVAVAVFARRPSGAGPAPEDPRPGARVVILGFQYGRTKPCGCVTPQAGGLDRAVAAVHRLAAEGIPQVVVQVGGALGATPEPHEGAKATLFAEFLRIAGARAAGLLDSDAALREALEEPGAVARVDLSAEGAQGPVGVLAPPFMPAETIRVDLLARGGDGTEPVPVLRIAVRTGKPRAGTARDRALTWTCAVRPVHGPAAGASSEWTEAADGETVDLDLPDRCRGLGVIEIRARREGILRRYRALELDPSWEAEPGDEGGPGARMKAAFSAYAEALREARYAESVPVWRGGAGPSFVGVAGCASCHEEEHRQWGGTGHARAHAALAGVGADANPECIGCHVTGWRREPGGRWFREESGWHPAAAGGLEGVGCESCHGPGSDHAAEPGRRAYGGPAATGGWTAVCVRCHDAENSHGFLEAFAYTRLPRVRHAGSGGR